MSVSSWLPSAQLTAMIGQDARTLTKPKPSIEKRVGPDFAYGALGNATASLRAN